MYCTNSKDEFEFNLDNIGTTGEILINDFVTKRQYRLKLFEHEHLLWWVNILCSSQCYSHYRKNDQIYLVVPVNEHLKYICGKSSERSEDGKSPTEGGVTFGMKPYIKHVRDKSGSKDPVVFDKRPTNREGMVFDREYYDQSGNIYPHKVIEIECEPIYNDVMTCDIERITNIFELKSIIYSLRSKL